MEHYPGQRLSQKGQLCTVRYVGSVADKPGTWLGVEWDDPGRGKHDGTHDGKKYLECRSKSPSAASFLKPNQKWDPPRTFYQALREKYMPEDAGTGGEIVYFSSKQAEEVGFGKFAKRQAALQGIKTIVLDRMRINAKDLDAERDKIVDSCKDVMELDLGSNLFETLYEILQLVSLLPKLRSLVLDGNRFDICAGRHEQLDRISTLALTETLLSWPEIASVLGSFPGATIVSAAANGLGHITADALPSDIKELDLSKNDFLALSDLACLSSCIQLRTIILRHNPIGLVRNKAASQNSKHLSDSVGEIDMAHNAISSWSFFDSLPDAYPFLRHLRVTGNPLYKDLRSAEGKPFTTEDGYMLTLARLPGLETLNYSKIAEKERLNAETYYLNQIAAELSSVPPEKKPEVLSRHPRWKALCEEYGESTLEQEPRPNEIDLRSLAARLVKITFVLGLDTLPLHATRTWQGEVPKSFNTYALLGLVAKKLGQPPLKLRLTWETGEFDLVAKDGEDSGVEWWDSDVEDGSSIAAANGSVAREVELVSGTRAIGTYINGLEAKVRVELR